MNKKFTVTKYNDPLLIDDRFKLTTYKNTINVYRITSDYKRGINDLTGYYKLTKNCKKFVINLLKNKFKNLGNASLAILTTLEYYRCKKYASKIKEKCRIKHNITTGNITLEYARAISLVLSNSLNESIKTFNNIVLESKYLVSKTGQSKIPVNTNELNSDLAYLAGVICGDGHITPQLDEIKIADGHPNKDLVIYSYRFIKMLKRLFERNFCYKGTIEHSENMCQLRLSSNLICRVMNYVYEIPEGCKCDKIKTPKIIKNKENESLFWRGVFDTDGSIRNRLKRISLKTNSKSLITDLNLFCKKNNIKTINEKNKNGYAVRISNDDILKFATIIGSSHPRKSENLSYYLRKGPYYKIFKGFKNNFSDSIGIYNSLRPYKNGVYISFSENLMKTKKSDVKKILNKIKNNFGVNIVEIKRKRYNNHYYVCSQYFSEFLKDNCIYGLPWNPLNEPEIVKIKEGWEI